MTNVDTIGQVVAIRYRDRMYDHYAILDGDGYAIHVHKRKGLITRDPLPRILKGATRVQYVDDTFDARLRNYEHAKALIGSKHSYKFLTDNCESWTSMIRTGKAYSRQVDDAINATSACILAISGILALGKCGG